MRTDQWERTLNRISIIKKTKKILYQIAITIISEDKNRHKYDLAYININNISLC